MAQDTAVKDEELEPPQAPAESAPAKKPEGDAGGAVDTSENDSNEGTGSDSGVPIATVVELRKDRRALKARLQEQAAELEQLRQQVSRTTPRPDPDASDRPARSTDFFDDPEKHLQERERRVQLETIRAIELISEKKEALKLIRSQEGFTPEDEDALVDLMEENGLDVVAVQSPIKAAKLAIKLWREEKGLAPDRSSPAKKAQAGSVRGSAPVGGPAKLSRSHLADLQRRASRGEDVRKELDEAWKAANEGRISED